MTVHLVTNEKSRRHPRKAIRRNGTIVKLTAGISWISLVMKHSAKP